MRKGELIINLIVIFGPAILLLLIIGAINIASSIPRLTLLLIIYALLTSGLIAITKAKLSMFRQGLFFSFGPKQMSRNNRFAYFAGYLCLFSSFVLSIGYIVAAKFF